MVEEYAKHWALRGTEPWRLRHIVAVADLGNALKRLKVADKKYWAAVMAVGVYRLSEFEAAVALQISQQAVSKRYRHGLEELHYYINYGGE
jgi:hypothetical protein